MACGSCGGRRGPGVAGVEYEATFRDGSKELYPTMREVQGAIAVRGGGTFRAVAKKTPEPQ